MIDKKSSSDPRLVPQGTIIFVFRQKNKGLICGPRNKAQSCRPQGDKGAMDYFVKPAFQQALFHRALVFPYFRKSVQLQTHGQAQPQP